MVSIAVRTVTDNVGKRFIIIMSPPKKNSTRVPPKVGQAIVEIFPRHLSDDYAIRVFLESGNFRIVGSCSGFGRGPRPPTTNVFIFILS